MTQTTHTTNPPAYRGSLTVRMFIGAGIGLVIILFFVLGVDNPKPEWPKLWMVRPLIVVPFAGAMGGLFFHFMGHLRYRGGWKKIMANVLSIIIFLFIIWIGIILGLDGTLWD